MNINLWIPCRAYDVNIILLFIKTFKKVAYEILTSGLFHARLYLEMLISALLLNIFEVIIIDIQDLEMTEFIFEMLFGSISWEKGYVFIFKPDMCVLRFKSLKLLL